MTGQSWFLVGGATSSNVNDIFFTDAQNGSLVLELGKIYSTTNGGVNWVQTFSAPLSGRALCFINGKGFMTAAGGRIFRSMNNGASWSAVVNNSITNINGLSVPAPSVLYMIAEDRLVYKSIDGGNSFSQTGAPVNMSFTNNIEFADENTGIIVGSVPNLKRTTDGGATWNTIDPGTNIDLYGAKFMNSTTGFITGDLGVVYKTTNAGLNWSSVSTGTSNTFNSVWFIDESTGFVGGINQKMFRTVNGGLNWSQVTGITSSVNDICFTDAGTGFAACSFGLVFRTTNGGVNWQPQQNGFFAHNSVTFVNSTTGYTSTDEGIVYKTTNAGLNWNTENRINQNPLKRIRVCLGNNIIAAGQYGTVLKYGSNITSSGSNNNELPLGYRLEQNYPNPFNPSTKVKFSIPSEGNVKLTVFDITGKEVRTLVNEKMSAGNYETGFNAPEISSGIYFYRLDVTGSEGVNFSETRKMVLIK